MLDGMGVRCRPGDIERFLRGAVAVTGLTLVSGPHVSEAHGQGIATVQRGHVSVHVWDGRAFADAFVRAEYDRKAIVTLAERVFGGVWIARYFER